ncbi:hypothetical protein K402DRAFT_419514 [Aulographum hederae CBS 113979]|uniref:Uncharacterized protein n=1 Tax=Aulographum hederae CBS 113979 TaxID=1176131 RepID=A0A6G1H4S6_9PEZI|nr:hypothetical protein K402DRAFT_419514 [Aulographum hederae CBS 113979]
MYHVAGRYGKAGRRPRKPEESGDYGDYGGRLAEKMDWFKATGTGGAVQPTGGDANMDTIQ